VIVFYFIKLTFIRLSYIDRIKFKIALKDAYAYLIHNNKICVILMHNNNVIFTKDKLCAHYILSQV